MIDLHSHILYGIDDGSKTKEESLEILNEAYKNGITNIVVTPHYIKDSKYQANNEKKQELIETLQKELQKRDIHINLYMGNEVYITEGIPSLLQKNISTINNSNYLLIELPMGRKPIILEEVLEELIENKITPIIAHPERYLCYYKDYNFFYKLKEYGCYFQGNIASLYGYYGIKTKKMLKELLKRNLIDFFGSDIHSKNQDFYSKNIYKEILKIVKKDTIVQDILTNNSQKVLNNQNIDNRSENNG